MQRPDVLVLGAGGTVGAAWMGGVLAGIAHETGIDFAICERIVGTSAGAMLAADLLASEEPREPQAVAGVPAGGGAAAPGGEAAAADDAAANGSGGERAGLLARAARAAGGVAGRAVAPVVPRAIALTRPAGALVRATALARLEQPVASLDDLGARIAAHGLTFDGRLRVACVERESGRRVVFGAPGAPDATVAEAVQASCSVPWTHRPVRIGERDYVDGAVWSPVNLDAAPAMRETHVLCLAPMGAPLGERERRRAVRAGAAAAIALETVALRRRGAHVQVVVPEPAPPAEHARVTGFRQGRALARAAGARSR